MGLGSAMVTKEEDDGTLHVVIKPTSMAEGTPSSTGKSTNLYTGRAIPSPSGAMVQILVYKTKPKTLDTVKKSKKL